MRPDVAITPDLIDHVVARFYARVRLHPVLGPVFATHVSDWDSHEEKIARFWRNAILQERGYDGNPMQKHRGAGNVHAGHFEVWLDLFDQVLAEELPQATAQVWSELAHRIGRSLKIGLTMQLRTAPDLRAG